MNGIKRRKRDKSRRFLSASEAERLSDGGTPMRKRASNLKALILS